MSYSPPPFPSGIGPGKSHPSAKALQGALKGAGYMPEDIPPADMYGPATQQAVRAFHATNPAYGVATDSAIGPHGWDALFRQAYGGAPRPVGEPAPDYRRLFYGGRLVNLRTEVLLERARARLDLHHPIILLQGSYNTSVSASAGTHSGGGVVDVDPTQADHWRLVKALREVGFAAWYRTPSEGPWGYHIHACAIGDAQMASVAREQVRAYFNGRNGLAGNGPDTAPASVGRPYPQWAAKYK